MSLKFEPDDSPWGFSIRKYPCPDCGGTRYIHISDMARPYAAGSMVDHLTFKCANCFGTKVHSPPISEEYFEELKRRRGGMTIYCPWSTEYQGRDPKVREEYLEIFEDSDKQEILRRLRDLGYM